ncbi:MAG: LLM class flavin-dependent oxidoreductase [Actinomycetaceae bacterium]|nr:LLM class flavin-dependent oxidoreductase [Actinomycetaceae bacterium]
MTKKLKVNILDLAPVSQGMSRKQALDASLEVAKMADQIGYHRYWMAEHHGSTAFMSSATSLLLTRAAEHTERIRLGAGGVMLPNHAPLMVAEYYGTLATIYGDRIDLGLGRAPGTDPVTAAALKRGSAELHDFNDAVAQLHNYFAEDDTSEVATEIRGSEAAALGFRFTPEHPLTKVRAIPGQGTKVPLWMLGSSMGGALVGSSLGLPYVFASHFAPTQMESALQTYRTNFNADAPTAEINKPYVMAGINLMVAPTDEEANYLYTTTQQMRSHIRRGHGGQLQPPVENLEDALGQAEAGLVSSIPTIKAVGSPARAARAVTDFANKHQLDEVIVVCWGYDPAKRIESLRLLAAELDLASSL